MFDLSFEKLLVIGVIALFLVGPERLPRYAAQLGRYVRMVRGMADSAKARLRDEMGPEFDAVDWQRLDPRQYDPRRIIRDALIEDRDPVPVVAERARSAAPAGTATAAATSVGPAGFDPEST